jgi:hypothetical protein
MRGGYEVSARAAVVLHTAGRYADAPVSQDCAEPA